MVTIQADRCKGCGLCVEACPRKILRLAPNTLNSRGYHPAEIFDEETCTSCAFCAQFCPDLVIHVEKEGK